MQFEGQLLPAAFARAVSVESTFSYMGSLMTFLRKVRKPVAASP